MFYATRQDRIYWKSLHGQRGKIRYALSDVRDKIYISTKTKTTSVDDFWENLNTSLDMLKTDYIDIFLDIEI